jgi:hypothetical protein
VDAADLGYAALGKWMEEAYLVFSSTIFSGDEIRGWDWRRIFCLHLQGVSG